MSNDTSDLVCSCRGCDHEFSQQCSDAKCECCTLEDHVKGSNAEDATIVCIHLEYTQNAISSRVTHVTTMTSSVVRSSNLASVSSSVCDYRYK